MDHAPAVHARHRARTSHATSAATNREDGPKRRWAPILLIALLVTGCLRIPVEGRIVSHRGLAEQQEQAVDCSGDCTDCFPDHPMATASIEPHRPPYATPLPQTGFTLVNWNVQKGKRAGWAEDFAKLSRQADIFIVQEAYLDDGLKALLHRANYQWDMTTAFEYRRIASGVLTAARATPNMACMLRETEPIIRVPKSALINRYPLAASEQDLMVANIHAINFSIGHLAFTNQMDRLEGILRRHRGPMILSGDFNTWSDRRMAHVTAMVRQLGLTAVTFEEDRRSRFFGRDIDHVYYRGLEAVDATIPMVTTSDHNPLAVTFKTVAPSFFVP